MPSNIYQSEFTGPQMDARFAAVAELQSAVAALETAVAAKYAKPADGIPSTDMDAAVQNALAKALTAVQSLADYYTKAETDALLAAIAASVNATAGVTDSSLPTASASTVGKMYYIGPDGNGEYARYVTAYDGTTYSWLSVGTTDIDLTQYATKAEVSQLDQKVAALSGGGYTPEMTIEQGALYPSTGEDIPGNNRIRTNGFINAGSISITTSGAKVYVFGYKQDGTYIACQGWYNSSQTVQIAGADKYRLVFAKSNDGNLTPSDFDSLGIGITAIYNEIYAQITVMDARDIAATCGAEKDKALLNNGEIISASGYSITDFLAIDGGDISLDNVYATPAGACGCAFYNSVKQLIGYKSTAQSGIQQLIVESANIPDGTKYIRSTFSTSTQIKILSGVLFLSERNREDIINTTNNTDKIQQELIFPSWNELEDSAIKNDGTIIVAAGYAVTDYLPLNGEGVVIRNAYATPAGASGCVYFDADKQYIGYASTNVSGVQDFSILASNIPSGAKYIRSTYEKNNGVIIYESGIKDQADRFDEGGGIFRAIPSASEWSNIKTESERNRFRGRGGLYVANWNIGHFSFGNSPNSEITESDYSAELAKYRAMVSEMDADLMALCEYSAIFGNDGNTDKATKSVLFSDVPIRYEGVQDNYVCNAIMSYKFVENIQKNDFASLSTNSYYLTANIPLNGKTIKLVCTHLTRDETDASQIAEINELIALFANDDYVIMMADWNVIDKDDFDLFTLAGYSLANKGEFGDIDTFTPSKSLPEGDTRVLDNIITKGFKIYEVRVLSRDLSDHYPIVCGLMME